jgi:uncharacterized protein (TIGR02246 family)
MNFRQTLEEHLRAVRERDLDALVATLPPDRLVLIMADGRLVRSVAEFVRLHREWVAADNWTLGTEVVDVRETAELGVAVVHLDYRERPAGKEPTRATSLLTLVFARGPDGRWLMVHDQNTPIKDPALSG